MRFVKIVAPQSPGHVDGSPGYGLRARLRVECRLLSAVDTRADPAGWRGLRPRRSEMAPIEREELKVQGALFE